jgi:hypothetical protein
MGILQQGEKYIPGVSGQRRREYDCTVTVMEFRLERDEVSRVKDSQLDSIWKSGYETGKRP